MSPCRICLAGLIFIAAGGMLPLAASETDAKSSQPEIESLIQELAADAFETRERARKKLIEFGLAAKQAVLEGMENPDPEIQYQCRRIWSIIRREDFQRRLQAFLGDRDPKNSYGLPAWDRFHALLGNEKDVRQLFVEMQKCEPGLMEALQKHPEAAGDAYMISSLQLQQMTRHPNTRDDIQVGSITALLFASAHDKLELPDQAFYPVYSLVHQPVFQKAIKGNRSKPLKQLLGKWVMRCDGNLVYQALMLSLQFELKEGKELAKRMIEKGGHHHTYRQYAILTLGKLGDDSDLDVIYPLLEDKTVCGRVSFGRNKRMDIQIRDVALGVLVHRSDQKLEDYGFEKPHRDGRMLFGVNSLRFASEEARNKALEKWRKWKSEQASK